MCQGALRDPWPSGRRAFSVWEPRSMARGQEALNLGLLGQEACLLPRRVRPPPAVFSRSPMRAVRLVPHQAGIECCTCVALQPCAELPCLSLCLLLQP